MDTTTLSAHTEPHRLQIVELLREGPLTVGEIASQLEIRQPQASKHLRVLHDAGIVEAHVDANRRIYKLRPEPFINLNKWLESYRQIWDERYDRLDSYLEVMQKQMKDQNDGGIEMTDKKTNDNMTVYTEGKTLVMELIFNAPRELVFKAYSEPEHLASWWGPRGWLTEIRKFEFKPEGVWHYCMRCVDRNQGDFYGQESWGKAIYKDIIAPEKIVYIDMFSDENGNAIAEMPEIFVTMNFIEEDGKTKLTIHSQFALTEALQQVMDMGVVQGTSSQLERLDELLETL